MAKVALVMGGGHGTGRAIALALHREGARVVIADIDTTAGAETVDLICEEGGEACFIQADMASSGDVQAAVDTARKRFGGLHQACNSGARGIANQPVTEITEEDWDRCMSVTLRGVWLCMKYQLPLIEASGGGAIVNIASVSGMRGEVMQAAYSAAKAGVITLTKSVAVEYARRGVRVNAVCPGGIKSGGMALYLDQMPEALRQKTLDAHAMGRLAEPAEIADAAAYLCSERASFVTGQALVVDGGVMVRSNVIEV